MATGLYNVLKDIYDLEELNDDVSNLPCPILS